MAGVNCLSILAETRGGGEPPEFYSSQCPSK